ncbi:MAG: hypothetical protein HY761_09885 [Candidatus Omnitrophica bacterium]|nr:hypothetical protein [Candidatus Omnitrophota bacterium]
MNFWVPRHRYELLNWILGVYPQEKSKFKCMKTNQLYAIYYKLRKDNISLVGGHNEAGEPDAWCGGRSNDTTPQISKFI